MSYLKEEDKKEADERPPYVRRVGISYLYVSTWMKWASAIMGVLSLLALILGIVGNVYSYTRWWPVLSTEIHVGVGHSFLSVFGIGCGIIGLFATAMAGYGIFSENKVWVMTGFWIGIGFAFIGLICASISIKHSVHIWYTVGYNTFEDNFTLSNGYTSSGFVDAVNSRFSQGDNAFGFIAIVKSL